MKFTLTIVILYIFIINGICQDIGHLKLYSSFKAEYSLKNYYRLNSKLNIQNELFSILENAPLIDTSYFLSMNLIDSTYKGQYSITNLAQYECHILAMNENNTFDCIISYSYTTNAGNGDPIILVSTYDKNGNFLSRIKLDLIFQNDYSPIPKQYFKMKSNHKIIFDTKSRNYIIVGSGEKERLKYENTDHLFELYLIDKTGIIKQMN
ncbi:MAG: hypothetical protein KA807_11970 [Prolixibacteraceae bacterium]|nr:hypothetical protein [Prolixibacteraceae bacterium]